MDGGHSSAPSAQSPAPARAAVDVIAITTRDDFLLELGATLGGQASINPVESAAQALEQLQGAKRPQVVIIDGRDMSDMSGDVATIQSQAPQASIVACAAEGAEQDLSAALRGSGVFAVLSLPLDAAKTSAVFGGAAADAKARQAAPPALPLVPEVSSSAAFVQPAPADIPAASPVMPEAHTSRGGRNFRLQIVFGGVALLILMAGLIAYFTKDKAPVPPAPSTATVTAEDATAVAETALPAVETSLIKGKVDELLEKARLAMRERRYAEPSGDNALLYYRSAAATDASNAEALDGLNRIARLLGSRFEEALGAGQLDEAATALAQFKNALPEDPQVQLFQQRLTSTQVSKAIAEGNLDRAAALVRAAQQSNLLPAAQVSRWRSEISRLQEEARQKRAADTAAREAAAAAEQKKVRDARAAAAAEAERQTQAAREKEREQQLKAEQAAQAVRAAESSGDAAEPRTPTALQSSLKRKRYVAPEYPVDAQTRRIGGVVSVTFTVDTRGETRDIQIVKATPPGVFERAATAAVKRWRYEPPTLDGVPTEVPVRMQIRFAPPD